MLQWKIWFNHHQSQVFTERIGEVTSPDYPTPYPVLSSCSYSIQVEDGFLITLEFMETFNVETYPGVLCPCDVLKVKTPKKQFGPFCGRTLPAKIETQVCHVPVLKHHPMVTSHQCKRGTFWVTTVLSCDAGYALLEVGEP
ncbi:mannan-binding lectin serine protease 2-like [Harpia harpyja]|uniref:mannan-binding lectin serine protease 2-like n=1 Tax=Harpia harpyja TaxID=202280 RepID=UPI0022B19869|nr:mannan-binding lectin serine protease 2-like [Harpia harpyja]